jgi:hypothetical protein
MTDSFHIDAEALRGAWQCLSQRWHETLQVWNDPVLRQFEKEFWRPLETEVSATQRELEQLAKSVSQARRAVR